MHSEVFHVTVVANSQYSKALWYENDSPLTTLISTCAHKHIHATTHVHIVETDMRGNVTPRQAHGSSFQGVLRDVAERPQWVLKQRGISINKALTAQLY